MSQPPSYLAGVPRLPAALLRRLLQPRPLTAAEEAAADAAIARRRLAIRRARTAWERRTGQRIEAEPPAGVVLVRRVERAGTRGVVLDPGQGSGEAY